MAFGSDPDNYDVTAKQNATTERSAAARLDRLTEDRLYTLYRSFFKAADNDRAWNIWTTLPWDDLTARPSPVLAGAVLSAYRDELFLPDFGARTLAATRSSRGRAWFVTRWTYDEGKHLLALTEWLVRSQAVDPDLLRIRSDYLLGHYGWEPPSNDAIVVFVEALLWEFRERRTYERLGDLAETAGDGVLKALCDHVLIDEAAHASFFRDSLRIIADAYPDRVREAARIVAAVAVNDDDGHTGPDLSRLVVDLGLEHSGVRADMPSVWAVGDVHGEAGMLETLLKALPRADDDITVFLGDFIDRGPDSAHAVALALSVYDAAPDRTILLWGNHEDMAAVHFGFSAPSGFEYDPYDWFANGGLTTLQSYGHEPPGLFAAPCPDDLARLFPLLRSFWRAPADLFPELRHVVWVHAGLLPGQQPEDASGETLLWVREEFLDHTDLSGRLVVHGHTPLREVQVSNDKIGIDTGAVFGGVLTALQLPERVVYQADADGHVIRLELLSD